MSHQDGHSAFFLVLLLGGIETMHAGQNVPGISGGDGSRHSLPKSVFGNNATLTQKVVANHEDALESLRSPHNYSLRSQTFFDEITSDPRFDELLKKARIAERIPRHS